MRRRDFLIVTGALASPLAPAAAALAQGRAGAPDLVIYDARYDACRRFAGALAARGSTTAPAHTDVARLWYGPLRARAAGAGIAGLTTWADFQVIRGCAAEARLTLRHVAFHGSAGAHRIERGDRRTLPALTAAGADWPEALAGLIGGAPARSSPAPQPNPRRGALVSWHLA